MGAPLTNRRSSPRFLRYKQLSFEEKKQLRALCGKHTQVGVCKLLGLGRETLQEALSGTLIDATYQRIQRAILSASASVNVLAVVVDPDPEVEQ